MSSEPLIPKDGGCREMRSFQAAPVVYDVRVRLCERYVDRFSRTRDQMVQAARSGVQNIAEGSEAPGTSRKMEPKLAPVARASLEELKLDYEDLLRQNRLGCRDRRSPLRQRLVDARPRSVDGVADWIRGASREILGSDKVGGAKSLHGNGG
ncbi:four helix bundle protein [Desulfoplanes sp.]